MDTAERARMAEAIRQTEAIWALEGFEPTPHNKAINEAMLKGRVTPSQVIAELKDYVRQHKTMDGFVSSRSWASNASAGPHPHGCIGT